MADFSSFGKLFRKGLHDKRKYCCNAGAIVQSDWRIGVIVSLIQVLADVNVGPELCTYFSICHTLAVMYKRVRAWICAGSVVIPELRLGKKMEYCRRWSSCLKRYSDGVLAVGNRCKVIKNIVCKSYIYIFMDK